MGMLFPGVVAAAFLMTAVQQGESLGVSNRKLCQDADCTVAISDAVALSDYDHGSVDSRFLSFPKGANVVVYSKSAGSRMDLWSGEYEGKQGFFSKSYVKETAVHHSEPSFMVPVEDEVEVEEEDAADGVDLDDIEAAAEEVVAAASSVLAHSDKADDAIVVSPADELKEPSAAEPGASRLTSVADATSSVAPSDAQQQLPVVAASADVSGSISTSDAQQSVLPAAGNDSVSGVAAAAAVQISSDTVAPASAIAEASERDGQSDYRSEGGEQHLKLHPTPVVNSNASTTVSGLSSQASKLPSSIDQLESKSSDGVDNGGGDLVLPADVANGDLRPESPVAVAADHHGSHAASPPAAGGGGARGGTVSPSTDASKAAVVADRAELESSSSRAVSAVHTEASAESKHTGMDASKASAPSELQTADGSETVNATARVDSPATDGNVTAQGNLSSSAGSQAGAVEPGTDPHRTNELPTVDDAKHADLPPKIASSQLDEVVPRRLPDGGESGSERHGDAAYRGLHDRLHAADKLLNRAARQQQEQAKRTEAGGEERLLPTEESGLRSSDATEEHNETLVGDGKLSTLPPLPAQLSPPDLLGPSDGEAQATSNRPAQPVKSGSEDLGKGGVTLTTSSPSGVEGVAGGNQSTDDSSSSSSSSSSTGAGDESAHSSVLIDGTSEQVQQQHVSSVQHSATVVPQPNAEPSFVETTAEPAVSHSAGDISTPAAEAIVIDYDSVLSGFERSPPTSYVEQVELQLWRVASGLPPFVQQVMQVRPLGLEPPMFLLANLISLWLILCSTFALCFAGCCDNRAKAKTADARCAELYKQLNVAEVEVKELQAALQEAERRASEEARDRKADYETRVGALEDQIKTLEEQAESESQRWSSLAADGEEKLRQATAELDSSRTLVTQWQAYAQDLDAKLKAALALGPDLEARCVEAELLAQSHREKTAALETVIVRLEDEVLLLKQERDHLTAEATDRDEKARELEARLQQQDAERTELRAAVAACELKTASLRESYQLLLLAGGDVADAAGDSGSPTLETAAADEAESEERREPERRNSADATCEGDPAAMEGDVSSGENEGTGRGGSLVASTVDRAAFARRRQSTKVVEQHLRQLEEAAKARQELEDLREQSVSLKEQLQLARASLLELEDLSRKHLAEKSDLVSEISALKRAKDEADMSLKVLTAYFKEKEVELQRTLGEKEHSSRTSGANVIELQQMCSQLQAERDQLRQEVRDVRDEMRASEKDLRKRLLENEKKAYDAWVLQRNKERELAAQQTECSQLRQKLLDAELARTKQNEALSELRLQLELEKAKCQEANAALAAANAAAATASTALAATTGDSANESGLSLESGGVGPRPAAGSQRPTSRSSTAAAASMTQRLPLLPPPPPVLPPLPLLPPLRPPLPPPFAMAPSMGLPPPGIVPMMPPMPNMLRDRRSMSPTLGERALPRPMMTPPVDGPMGGVPQQLPPPPMLPPAMAFDPRLRPAYGGMQDPRDGVGQLPPMHPHHAAMPPRGVPPTFDGMPGAPPLLQPHGMRGPLGPQGTSHLRPPHLAAAFDPRADSFGGGGAARPPLGSVDLGRQFVPVEAQPFQGRDPTLPPAASSPLQRYAAASGHEFAGAAAAGQGHRQPETPMNLSAISNDARNASQSSEPGSGRNVSYGVPPTGYGAPPTGGRV